MIEWVEVARRSGNHPLLNIDNWVTAFVERRVSKVMGLPFDITAYRQFDGARWISRENIEECRKQMEEAEKKHPGYLLDLATKFEKDLEHLKTAAEKLNITDYEAKLMSNDKLLALLEEWFEHQKQTVAYDYQYIMFINPYLTDKLTYAIAQKVKDPGKQAEILATLASSEKQSDTMKELASLLEIARKIREGVFGEESIECERAVEEHISRFAHLKKYFYAGEPYTVEDVKKRLKNFVEQFEAKERLVKSQSEADKEVSQIIRELALGVDEILTIKTMRKWVFVINELDESWTRYIYKLQPVLRECARRLGVSYEELIQMRVTELKEALCANCVSKELVEELRERAKDNALILENGEVRVLTGERLRAYYAQERSVEEAYSNLMEVRGTPASPGIVKGIAKVVLAVEELDKVGKGDVLIAHTTTPAWTMAMERAAAIVANEGGLLCHAAIVSRELGIPCIVGTRIATKVFRDGDLVEVDAINGVIKRIFT